MANPATRQGLADAVRRLGYSCQESDHPYAAMAELCRRPLSYQAVILSLAGLYREELSIVRALKRRFPQTEIWLTHTDGRQAALAEAMRLGADGLLDDEGLHRVGVSPPAIDVYEPLHARRPLEPAFETARAQAVHPKGTQDDSFDAADGEEDSCEPILSADELRALLQEHPGMAANGDENA